ncbi:hemerythrin domain-containing protein [Intrasporangium sp.]|uniref:hemerythrin domain-containing protein n=1 Tax=Intrasporangium sp. TaxID=1925024 RepID=UPI002939D0EE|nr:hemerythrin domain-containing protein [Intrasporangium sp.]MDV3222638.1 hemerythrin domain-containing protein [Intrasporangium sp.]
MEARVATLHELRAALHTEHQHLWQLIAAARHAAADARRTALQRLLRYLAVHEAAEEVSIHNVWVDDSTRERLDEEREAAEIVERLVRAVDQADDRPDDRVADGVDGGVDGEAGAAAPWDDEFLFTLDQLERSLRDHADAEENEELPILATELTPEHLGEMLRIVLMVREVAEDRASPVADASFATMRLSAQQQFKAAVSQLR